MHCLVSSILVKELGRQLGWSSCSMVQCDLIKDKSWQEKSNNSFVIGDIYEYLDKCCCGLAQLLHLCLTLYNLMDVSPAGSSIHGILQARTPQQVTYLLVAIVFLFLFLFPLTSVQVSQDNRALKLNIHYVSLDSPLYTIAWKHSGIEKWWNSFQFLSKNI